MKVITSTGMPACWLTSAIGAMSLHQRASGAGRPDVHPVVGDLAADARARPRTRAGRRPGRPTSMVSTPSSFSRWRISSLSSMPGSTTDGFWMPSRRVSSCSSNRPVEDDRPAVALRRSSRRSSSRRASDARTLPSVDPFVSSRRRRRLAMSAAVGPSAVAQALATSSTTAMPWPPPMQAEPTASFASVRAELVDEVRRDARADGAERMAEGDGAAVRRCSSRPGSRAPSAPRGTAARRPR